MLLNITSIKKNVTELYLSQTFLIVSSLIAIKNNNLCTSNNLLLIYFLDICKRFRD